MACGQALGQKVKGPVFIPAMMAVAVGLAATGKTFDQGGAQEVGEESWDRRKPLRWRRTRVDLRLAP